LCFFMFSNPNIRIIQNTDAGENVSKSQRFSCEPSSGVLAAQWARIALDKVVVAIAERSWLYQIRSDESGHRFAQPTNNPSCIATTRQLLDGAIAAARYAVSSNLRPPALTPLRWVWRLAGQYHLCHSVPQLLQEAQKHFTVAGREVLAQWAAHKAQEEQGHDRLALRDLKSMGYNAEAVVKALVPSAAVTLMDYFTRSVQDTDPIDCVGYSYTMERLALGVDEEYIQKVEQLLPSNIDATRCLRVHSSVGADAEHVEETVEMVAELTSFERVRVARACYETALLCFSPPKEGYLLDAALQPTLKPLKLSKSL
jgi:hypothetical protein